VVSVTLDPFSESSEALGTLFSVPLDLSAVTYEALGVLSSSAVLDRSA
jgi:hypothetical protein